MPWLLYSRDQKKWLPSILIMNSSKVKARLAHTAAIVIGKMICRIIMTNIWSLNEQECMFLVMSAICVFNELLFAFRTITNVLNLLGFYNGFNINRRVFWQWLVSLRNLRQTFVVLCPIALIFEGSVNLSLNPAHPKHIGSIDPSCEVVEVIKGNKWSSSFLIQLCINTRTHWICYLFSTFLFAQNHDCLTFNHLIFLESIYRVELYENTAAIEPCVL